MNVALVSKTARPEMRELRCPICGTGDRRLLYRETFGVQPSEAAGTRIPDPEGGHYRINRCQGCGLVYSSPIFGEAAVRALYTDSHDTNVRAGEETNVRRTFQLYYELVRRHLAGRHRMLDVGCDVGIMLRIARRDGFQELIGLEPNPRAATRAAAVAGCTIFQSFYETTVFPAGHFDLVTLIHVLDHMVDVNRVLAKILHELRPSGLVLAVVHNVGSLLSRVMGERFPPYNVGHHYFFSTRTLRLLFARAGFEVVRLCSTYNCYSLGFLSDKAPAVPPSLRGVLRLALTATGLERLPLTLPLGNIGIVARKPTVTG